MSKTHFRDAVIHAKSMLPESGSGNYELQIFLSLGKAKPDKKTRAVSTDFQKPTVWQVHDIRDMAPRRGEDDDRMVERPTGAGQRKVRRTEVKVPSV